MSLIQSNVKYYVGEVLSKCHERKTNVYFWVLNVVVLVLFVSGTAFILYCCYKKKPCEEEKKKRMLRDQQYVLEQIKFYQGQKQSMSAITDLPVLQS
jgi:hypothetical protein